MKPTMSVDSKVFDDHTIIVDFNAYDDDINEPTHFGGYVRIIQSNDAQCFYVVVIDVDGDVLSETAVPYVFRPIDE